MVAVAVVVRLQRLLAALPFKVEEAYFFAQNCEMTFSRNMLL
jgi:hypothetical protein